MDCRKHSQITDRLDRDWQPHQTGVTMEALRLDVYGDAVPDLVEISKAV
ncbi:hypothetical protein HMPREF1868_00483 [Olsenella sp. DNF00959]|nr:hypothetical protein HMPREF1868_00483 [Olsenella sp. DNF00959]